MAIQVGSRLHIIGATHTDYGSHVEYTLNDGAIVELRQHGYNVPQCLTCDDPHYPECKHVMVVLHITMRDGSV